MKVVLLLIALFVFGCEIPKYKCHEYRVVVKIHEASRTSIVVEYANGTVASVGGSSARLGQTRCVRAERGF